MHVGEGVHRDSLASEALLTCGMFYVVVLHLVSGHWANANKRVLKVGAYLKQERSMTSLSAIKNKCLRSETSICKARDKSM
jgi:hypothetical protein